MKRGDCRRMGTAFRSHRLSGIALALFLPLHFLVLGEALDEAGRFQRLIAFTAHPLVKLAESALVALLVLHLLFGLRLLVMEFGPWGDPRDMRTGWVDAIVYAGAAAAGLFLWLAL